MSRVKTPAFYCLEVLIPKVCSIINIFLEKRRVFVEHLGFLAFVSHCRMTKRGSGKKCFSKTRYWLGKQGRSMGRFRFFMLVIYRNTALDNLFKTKFKLNNGEVLKTINTESKTER